MGERYDPDTIAKIELINRKVDEINLRRMGIHTTKVEDELDCEELEAYIKTLNLTEEQRKIIDKYNKNDGQQGMNRGLLYFIIMAAGVVLQFYVGYEIYNLTSKGTLETLELAYLALLIGFFAFNTFQLLRYLRIVR
ncbi:hypothetical protein [Methanocella sp. MCL-LM]|uniref:hypothetical protein n=1 Tax=Methanocella sp. MCL-LM TaxID=3412035 RepID=UPI003C73F4B5